MPADLRSSSLRGRPRAASMSGGSLARRIQRCGSRVGRTRIARPASTLRRCVHAGRPSVVQPTRAPSRRVHVGRQPRAPHPTSRVPVGRTRIARPANTLRRCVHAGRPSVVQPTRAPSHRVHVGRQPRAPHPTSRVPCRPDAHRAAGKHVAAMCPCRPTCGRLAYGGGALDACVRTASNGRSWRRRLVLNSRVSPLNGSTNATDVARSLSGRS